MCFGKLARAKQYRGLEWFGSLVAYRKRYMVSKLSHSSTKARKPRVRAIGVVRRAWKRPAARRIWFVIVVVL